MTDLELLVLAAKAAGYTIYIESRAAGVGVGKPLIHMVNNQQKWDPLDDDGDALRLAVLLQIDVVYDRECAVTETAFMIGRIGYNTSESWGPMRDGSQDEPLAATRRAIVSAAAKIGKAM